MPFLMSYWKPIALTALVLIIFSFGWYKGYSYEKSKLDGFLKEQELFAVKQQANNELTRQNQDKILVNSAKAYNETIERVKKYYEANRTNKSANNGTNFVRVRDTSASGQSLPDVQKSTEISTEVRGNKDSALAEQCTITTLQYNSLHDAWTDLCKVSECK